VAAARPRPGGPPGERANAVGWFAALGEVAAALGEVAAALGEVAAALGEVAAALG
jgi:hypothetical protein